MYPDEDIGEVLDRMDIVEFAAGDQRLQDGEVLIGPVMADKEEALAAESVDPEHPVGDVVVQRNARVLEEKEQGFELVVEVGATHRRQDADEGEPAPTRSQEVQ